MKIYAISLLLLAGFDAAAQGKFAPNSEARFFKAHITRQASIQYLISLPSTYHEASQKWPLLFFLHGGSGRGDDIRFVSQYGPPAIAAKQSDYPFIVLSPQCPKGEIWTDTDLLISLLDDAIAHYRVDPDRIYLTGMSMGGRGVWYLASKHPDRFAAIVPINAAFPIAAWAQQLRRMPIWTFHGDKDNIVPISDTEEMVQALRAEGNDPKFTVLPGRGHDIADVYNRPDLYEWLLQHKRPR